MSKKWVEENGKHILYFEPFYEEERLAEVFYEKDIGWCCNSELLKMNGEYLGSDSLEDTKEGIEEDVVNHYEDERNYYQALLDKFKEE